MMELVKVVEVRALPGHVLWARFSDGTEGQEDMSAFVAEGGLMVEPLRDPSYFCRVFLSFGVPTWPNGFDVDAMALQMRMEAGGQLTGSIAAA